LGGGKKATKKPGTVLPEFDTEKKKKGKFVSRLGKHKGRGTSEEAQEGPEEKKGYGLQSERKGSK